ncbi:MAG: SH3 domain-containing protein [Alphaproteobacteria bacterium]|nr:SH3 domain-containing protein [Alphaproteobacteria bacterium]
MRSLRLILVAAAVTFLAHAAQSEEAQTADAGSSAATVQGARIGISGYPVPRFASLKTNQVNLREGPGLDTPIRWTYVREDLPVEIIAEHEHWRRVRDFEGTTGWVHRQMLSLTRTGYVMGKEAAPIREKPDDSSVIVAYASPGVIGRVRACDGTHCLFSVRGYTGYIPQSDLFGVYANETFE